MANSLTGDFDVVAEFSTGAVNRVLAAMHQTERFLHSISARVDDNPHPGRPVGPTVVGAVDGFGDAIANQQLIGTPNPSPGPSAANDPVVSRLGAVVNVGTLVLAPPQIIPSHISGVVQMQLSPPRLADPVAADAPLTLTTNLMTRFTPDKGTAPLAEFMRGDLSITAPINKVVSGGVRILDIDFKADAATINFTTSFTSTALSEEDTAGINLCIQNGLRTAFLPSSVNLPAAIADVQMKTLPGAIAILLDLNDHPSTSASVTNVFLGGSDDFALAVGIDYLRNTLLSRIGDFIGQTISLTFPVNLLVTTIHISYDVTLTGISVDLQSNQGVLTVQASAKQISHKGYLPDAFTLTGRVNFTLQADGSTADLVLGDANVNTSSFEINIFSGTIADAIKSAVDGAFSAKDQNGVSGYDTVRQMFDANQNLGQFLNPQLNPSDGNPPADPQQLFFIYNSVGIQPDGIVMHGSLLVFDFPAPHVEFEQVPPNTRGVHVGSGTLVPHGPDYSALNTWIPGGTITQYEWSVQGQEQAYPFDVDPNRFVLLHSGPAVNDPSISGTPVPGFAPLCLTITGTRISNFGPIVDQNVSSSVCGFTRFNVGALAGVSSGLTNAPMLAVARPGPAGEVVVTGHAAASIDPTGSTAPNLVVQFTDAKSLGQLKTLTEALHHSKPTGAPTAIIAALAPGELPKARFTPGIIYSEDYDGWLAALGEKPAHGPLTLIVNPKDGVVYRHEGAVHVETLAVALAKHLVKRGPVRVRIPRLNVRNGQRVPRFQFEYAPGRQMPINKLEGQAGYIAFWKRAAKTSIQAVRDLQANAVKTKRFVLAVNDGDDPEVARAVAAESGIMATVVTDPKREISFAYGVSLWPTVVSLNSSGIVTGIGYGYVPGEYAQAPTVKPTAA